MIMSNEMRRVGTNIRKDATNNQNNTNRVAANLPLVERKLDVIDGDHSYVLEFTMTNRQHSAMLNLQFRPDNCCDCEAGEHAQGRDATMIVDAFGPHIPGNSDGVDYPAIIHDPILNTGTVYHWVTLPIFWVPIANPYESYGGYTLAPDGKGVIVPVDGVYGFSFQNMAHGARQDTSMVRASIKRLPWGARDCEGNLIYSEANPPEWEEVAVRVYNNAHGNISSLKEWPLSTLDIYVYAMCLSLFKDDVIDGWLQAVDVANWTPGVGDIDGNKMTIWLMGLGLGSLEGHIYSTLDGSPVDNTEVHINGDFGDTKAITDVHGYFIFENITPRTYTVWTAQTTPLPPISTDVTVRFNCVAQVDMYIS